MQMARRIVNLISFLKLAVLLSFVSFPLLAASITQNSPGEARDYFGKFSKPSKQPSNPIGGYSFGCLAGGQVLPETGPTWQAMRLSRNRNWGHPVLLDYLVKLSEKAAQLKGWKGLYIGDLAQPRGGQMVSGHASHQTGLDVDIWMLPANNLNLTRTERENISSISLRKSRGAYVNDSWTTEHHKLLRSAASDPRVERIFVFPGAKVKMCKDEKGNRDWLRKIRPWYGHHYHFHVRLKCPNDASECVNQHPPPLGDGCSEAEKWVKNILNPPKRDPNAPKPKPKPPLTLKRIPKQCIAVLNAPDLNYN